MTKSQELLFELLLVSTGARKTLSQGYTEREWEEAYNLAEEQTITGVMLSALERIQENVNVKPNVNENANDNANLNNANANINLNERGMLPSKMLLLQWIGSCQMIEAETKRLEEATETTVRYFRENGFACQILKGCAVGRYYPEPLRRSSGDIDIWLDGGRKKIYDFARAFDKERKLYGVNYHHIHFHLIEDVHIEVHIWPSFLSSPLRNYRLHKFCNLQRTGGRVPVSQKN